MRNHEVLEMVRAGLADDNVVMAIESASHAEFDPSADALIALSKAGISNTVIRAMQNRY
jgi:hypothetical protein